MFNGEVVENVATVVAVTNTTECNRLVVEGECWCLMVNVSV